MAYDDKNIFARILRGEAPCIKVYEDDATLAIMDVMPQSEGHLLVLPKEGAELIYDLSPQAGAAAMATVQKMAAAVRKVLAPEGLLIAQFNGAARIFPLLTSGRFGSATAAPYSPQAAKASLKARSPGAPFSIAMMARRWLE